MNLKIGIIQEIYLILIKMDMEKLYILLKKEIEFIR